MAVRAAAAEAGSLVAEANKVRVAAGKRKSFALDERRRGGELFLWCAAARVEDDVVGVGDGDERNYGEQQTQRGEGGRHFAHRPASQLWSSTRAAREMHRLPRRTLELLLLLEGKSGSGSN